MFELVNMFDKKQHGQVSSQQAFSASPGRCKNVYVSTYHEINHLKPSVDIELFHAIDNTLEDFFII